MSKVLGIIAEYNPFHNGHLYHLKESKKITGADYTIAVISGNFTQRGSTSIVDKWSKAKMAIENGVDLVIELPTLYAISSAENFADGAIKILNSLGIVDYVSFGSETSDINMLSKISDILYYEPNDYKKNLSYELDKGLSFPKARAIALNVYLGENSNVLSSPNNILGIEYLKALKKYNSDIKPIAIQRIEADYNSTEFSDNIASSTAIRNLININDLDSVKKIVPESTYTVLIDIIKNGNCILDLSIFEKEIIYVLRKMSVEEISELPDVSEGIEFKIKEAVNSCNTIDSLLKKIKSKRYTLTRLQRILLYALLDINKQDMEIAKCTIPYVRVLGCNTNGKALLSKISKARPDLQLITSVKKFYDNNSDIDLQLLMDKDILATNVYTIGFGDDSKGNLDFTNNLSNY